MGPEILVPLMVFGLPAVLVFLHKHYKLRMRQLELQGADRKLLAANSELLQKTAELEARVQNLESIVVSSDFDARLAQRLTSSPAQARLQPVRGDGDPATLPQPAARPALPAAATPTGRDPES